MFYSNRIAALSLIIVLIFAPAKVGAAPSDVTQGDLTISGSVPEIFNLQIRGVPGDLDLSPNVVVNNRPLGLIHLKYNIPLASFIIKSDSATGLPTLNGAGVTTAPFSTNMTITVLGCSSVDAVNGTNITPANLGSGAFDIKTTAAGFFGAGFTQGIEEECQITASWVGTNTAIPLAGRYSMVLSVIITST